MNIICGDALSVLPGLRANYVHTVVTSPPYWGLRDYEKREQLGLERTPEEYVAKLVQIFRAVRRVLRDDGTLWINLGDSYRNTTLVGIPWRVAFALQADGWFLRSEIIWHKWNPMPESVTTRPTKAHEQIFLLTKSRKYFYDHLAVLEPAVSPIRPRDRPNGERGDEGKKRGNGHTHCGSPHGQFRNRRSVWSTAVSSFRGEHFAPYPPALIEPCILAGTRRNGIVLDPFAGAGTTLLVAEQLGRRGIGIELNRKYVELATERIRAAA